MSINSPRLNESEIQTRLQGVSGWTVVNGELQQEFALSSFPSSIFFVNAIAHLAERATHHPDLSISYDHVVVRISTHSSGGITDKDFALARDIDELWQVFKAEAAS